MALMVLIQLNIFATRNTGLWWRFTPKTAPRPSLLLVAAVSAVLIPATFIAVYWPEHIQPDGGRGVLIGAGESLAASIPRFQEPLAVSWTANDCPQNITGHSDLICTGLPLKGRRHRRNGEIDAYCAGWAKVGIVWAYAVAVWLVADAVKVGAQALFIRQEHVKEHCKMTDSPTPLWARAIDWPGNAIEAALDRLEVIACLFTYYALGAHSSHTLKVSGRR